MTPLVSIIMPIFNGGGFLKESLLSVKAQTYINWELIIVDDGSTDNSVAIYDEFMLTHKGKCRILYSPKKRSGAAFCRNIGMTHCKGELIIFLDSDDLLEPFCLYQRVNGLEDNDIAIFKQFRLEDGKSNTIFNGGASKREDAIHAFVSMNAPWQTMAPIWRKTALQKLNGFDETLLYMEDPDLHLRALLDQKIAILFRYDLPPDNYYRVNNMSADKLENFYDISIKSRLQFLRKILSTPSLMSNDYKKSLRFGYIIILKTFVLSRIQFFRIHINDISNELLRAGVFKSIDKIKIDFIVKIYSSNSSFIKVIRLKGLVYKLL
jgi:glycosyltransferase involved in cell wall biosynthesis